MPPDSHAARNSVMSERRASANANLKSAKHRSTSTATADQENRFSTEGTRKPVASLYSYDTRVEERYSQEIHRSTRSGSPKKGRPQNVKTHGGTAKGVADLNSQGQKMPPRYARWDPQATLIAHTNAPLASRISIPPLAVRAPQALQPPSLQNMSLRDQETAIVDDLLLVLMGFEGQYIQYVDTYQPLEEKDRLAGPTFRISPELDPSLRDMATAMLRMGTHYSALGAFIEVQSRPECGAVNHALCAAVRAQLKEYTIIITQLENKAWTETSFTLHQASLHTRPLAHKLQQTYNIACEVLRANSLLEEGNNDEIDDTEDFEQILESLREGRENARGAAGKRVCKGGSVLRLITKRLDLMAGDPSARDVLTTLLREASRPYMRMLNEWLHHGGINDPHEEFMIKEQKSIRREELDRDYTDAYWEKRYAFRKDDVPPQLDGLKEKVLLAGKYLNVVRECGGVDISKEVKDVPLTFDDPRFLENVNSAYAYANTSLLDLLLTTHALPARLRSLKHYFFLDRSDFFSYFLELGGSELKKPARHVNVGKLQSLLEIVLRQPGSVAAEDPFKEDVKVQMNEIGLTNWLMKIVNTSGLDKDAADAGIYKLETPAAASAGSTDDKDITGFNALVLDYAVPFPLSLVVSRVTLTRYQLLFRYLLSLQHLEHLLANSWTEQTRNVNWRHRSKNPKLELWKRKAWTLRARMLVFVQQLLYYCTAEVIEPNWQGLMSRLSAQEDDSNSNWASQEKRTVDELMQDHVDFLATCLQECMLTNSKLLRINSKVIMTCTMFAEFTGTLSRYLASADSDLASANANPVSGSKTPGAQFDPSRIDKMIDVLQKYEANFTRHLRILLEALNYLAATETAVFMSLCARLSTAMEGMPGVAGPGMPNVPG